MTSYHDSPVFLCGHRKSGTTVLLCLFDNHPELLTYPADSGFFYRVFPSCEKLSTDETVELVVRYAIGESLGPQGDAIGRRMAIDGADADKCQKLFDVEAIAESYRALALASDGAPAAHLKCLMEAYGRHCGQDPSRWKGWMEKTTSTEIYAVEVATWFPKAKFIHLVRDPRDNYASLKSGWQQRYQSQEESQRALLQSMIDRGGLGLCMANLNREALGEDRYKVLRFEDLTARPAESMAELAAFIGIDYDPSLETPTVNGALWPGNNFDGLRFDALSSINVGRWASRIERWEACVIEGFLGDAMVDRGYDLTTDPAERARACAEHYKWFNFLPKDARGGA